MKEKLIQEISTAMAEVLSFEQVAHLNSKQIHYYRGWRDPARKCSV